MWFSAVSSTGARGMELPPVFFNFLFTYLFSIKFLYFFIISSPFPYFNLFASIFMQSYANSNLQVSIIYTVDSRYLEFDGTMEKIRGAMKIPEV